MDISFYLLSLAVIPLFAARGALSLLSMVLLAEYYVYLRYLGLDPDSLLTQLADAPESFLWLDASVHEWLISTTTPLALLTALPEWLTSPTSIGVLCVLSIIEYIYNKSPDMRQLFPFGQSCIDRRIWLSCDELAVSFLRLHFAIHNRYKAA